MHTRTSSALLASVLALWATHLPTSASAEEVDGPADARFLLHDDREGAIPAESELVGPPAPPLRGERHRAQIRQVFFMHQEVRVIERRRMSAEERHALRQALNSAVRDAYGQRPDKIGN